jgi:hypothetical protein
MEQTVQKAQNREKYLNTTMVYTSTDRRCGAPGHSTRPLCRIIFKPWIHWNRSPMAHGLGKNFRMGKNQKALRIFSKHPWVVIR